MSAVSLPNPTGQLRKNWLQILTNILALLPLALLLWDFFANQLGFDPIREVLLRTGLYALVLLILSLACTPLNLLFGLRQVLPLRRTLGLYAFFYATLHFLTFVVLDYGLQPGQIVAAIAEKNYALVGFAAFLILLALAVTSTRGWMKRLGKNWKRLHSLVYVAAILAIVHFLWLVKSDLGEPLIYGTVLAGLLVLRVPSVRRRVAALRNRLKRRQATG